MTSIAYSLGRTVLMGALGSGVLENVWTGGKQPPGSKLKAPAFETFAGRLSNLLATSILAYFSNVTTTLENSSYIINGAILVTGAITAANSVKDLNKAPKNFETVTQRASSIANFAIASYSTIYICSRLGIGLSDVLSFTASTLPGLAELGYDLTCMAFNASIGA